MREGDCGRSVTHAVAILERDDVLADISAVAVEELIRTVGTSLFRADGFEVKTTGAGISIFMCFMIRSVYLFSAAASPRRWGRMRRR